jgi:nuclease S1
MTATKAGTRANVIFDGRPDNLHWIWDTGLLEHIGRNPEALAAELESHITAQDQAEWVKGSIEDWVLEGHTLAQTVAYGLLGSENPALIGPDYERQADPVIELQLEKAEARLARAGNAERLAELSRQLGPKKFAARLSRATKPWARTIA